MFASNGERFPPCGDPSSVFITIPFSIMARFALDNKVGGYRCRSQVPEHEILKIVRMYEPIITEFFDNEEEMAKFQKWREEYEEKERLEKEEKAKKKAGAA